MSRAPDVVVIDARDNVATAVRALETGEEACVGAAPAAYAEADSAALAAPDDASEDVGAPAPRALSLREPIPIYHKVALRDIAAGQAVVKYGEVIGTALADIRAGQHVHVHNVAGRRAAGPTGGGGAA